MDSGKAAKRKGRLRLGSSRPLPEAEVFLRPVNLSRFPTTARERLRSPSRPSSIGLSQFRSTNQCARLWPLAFTAGELRHPQKTRYILNSLRNLELPWHCLAVTKTPRALANRIGGLSKRIATRAWDFGLERFSFYCDRVVRAFRPASPPLPISESASADGSLCRRLKPAP